MTKNKSLLPVLCRYSKYTKKKWTHKNTTPDKQVITHQPPICLTSISRMSSAPCRSLTLKLGT